MNIPFSKYYGIKDLVMDKRRAIQIMTKAADIYRNNLEDQKVLFLYTYSYRLIVFLAVLVIKHGAGSTSIKN